jgi:tripartite-type tricarboxylate transporter receptor subunit TctC
VTNLRELAAKAKTQRLRFASPAITNHALTAVVAQELGFTYDEVPYKTVDQTVTAMLSGDADMTLNGPAGFTPHLQAGKMRAIAALAPQRTPLMPDVPTAKEQGANIEFRFNLGLWVPLGTPQDVVARLGAAVAEAVKNPSVVQRFTALSLVPSASTPEQLVRQFQSEVATYRQAAGIIKLQPQ